MQLADVVTTVGELKFQVGGGIFPVYFASGSGRSIIIRPPHAHAPPRNFATYVPVLIAALFPSPTIMILFSSKSLTLGAHACINPRREG